MHVKPVPVILCAAFDRTMLRKGINTLSDWPEWAVVATVSEGPRYLSNDIAFLL